MIITIINYQNLLYVCIWFEYLQEEELLNKEESHKRRQKELETFKSDLKTRYESIDKDIKDKVETIKINYEEDINKLIADNQ